MLLDHLFHQIEKRIDIHIGIDLVLIDFPEVVKYPSVVFSNHIWFHFDLQKYNFFPIWQEKMQIQPSGGVDNLVEFEPAELFLVEEGDDFANAVGCFLN